MRDRSLFPALHPCQRCGSDEWEYVDYGGCSECRSYEERAAEDEEDKVAAWVAWALTTPLRHGLTTFGGTSGSPLAARLHPMSGKDPREMSEEEYLDWLEETGQDVDQFDRADEASERGEEYDPNKPEDDDG